MSDQPMDPKEVHHGEADPPETLAAKVEALRASLKEDLPNIVHLKEEMPQLVREAVRKELQAERKLPEDGPLLTKEDVAAWLQVSPRTVDTLAASGELCKVKVRGCVRFSPGAVRAYVRQQAEGDGRDGTHKTTRWPRDRASTVRRAAGAARTCRARAPAPAPPSKAPSASL